MKINQYLAKTINENFKESKIWSPDSSKSEKKRIKNSRNWKVIFENARNYIFLILKFFLTLVGIMIYLIPVFVFFYYFGFIISEIIAE